MFYGKCGEFGICNSTKRPICSCLKGSKPRNAEEWSRGNWSSGCFRTTPLQCQRDNNNGSGAGQGDDRFLEMKMIKVPAFPDRSSIVNGQCKDQCLKNCSCVAYTYDSGIGCMMWSGDLIDVQESSRGVDLYIHKGKSSKVIVITTVIAGMVVITISALFLRCRMLKHKSCFFLLPHVAELAPLTDSHLCILSSAGVFNRLATIGELALLISSQLSFLAKLAACTLESSHSFLEAPPSAYSSFTNYIKHVTNLVQTKLSNKTLAESNNKTVAYAPAATCKAWAASPTSWSAWKPTSTLGIATNNFNPAKKLG
ncbi:hypothetical protein GOBAR_AA14626 [Gossypium barbadense]|uniref:Apple domain-containing protein n=1 Tax=Gossypium barbadense TaxID=3634 RepID=A0A2P5XRW6_GOSBA|nr:hypothetical protein GOBAR_AA14626 [Gossypium barbadense]